VRGRAIENSIGDRRDPASEAATVLQVAASICIMVNPASKAEPGEGHG